MLTSVEKRRLFATALTVLLGALATLVAWRYAHQVHQEREQAQFRLQVAQARDAINDRFAAYEQVLRSGVALFTVHPELSRAQWREFVAQLQTGQRYPGIQGIGFAERLDAGTLPEHLAEVRADGFPHYSVYPTLPADGQGSAIKYLEPFDARNRRAFGYDMYSHPVRRAAMARARDTGRPALSGHVTLLQETDYDRQAGTLLFLPLYRQGAALDTVAQRRAALRGWVYSPFRMKDLMRGTLGETLGRMRLELFDGEIRDPGRLLFRTDNAYEAPVALFRQDVILEVAGRLWLLSLSAPDTAPDATAALVVLGGALLTLLLAALVASIGRSEQRSVELALEMTEALRTSEARQRAILQSTADGILTINERGIVQSYNHAAERIFGYAADEVVGQNVTMLMPPRYRQLHDGYVADIENSGLGRDMRMRREVVGLRKNGEEFPVWLAVNRMPSPSGQREYVGMVSDISHRKKSERLLAEAGKLRRSILDNAPFAIISTDPRGTIQTVNPAAEKLLQYRGSELVGLHTPEFLHDAEELQEHAAELGRRHNSRVQDGFDALVAAARRGRTEEREWTWLRKDGQRVPVQAAVNALRGINEEIEGFLIIAYDVTERKNAQSYVQHLAHHDPLTNLPNRVLLLDRLEQAIEQARRQREKVAVLMVDLDHFKRINDSLGHHVGDDLLLAVADRLTRSVRRADTVSRLGGDEFVVVLPGVRDRKAVRNLVSPLLEILSAPFRVQEHEMTVTPSIGVALFSEHGSEARTLLKHADTAMYQAKEAGRRTWRFFDPDMLQQNQRRLETENALRKALQNEEMSLVFQPQVSFGSGEVVGCEALLRWRNPRLGEVPPASFVPIAEEMGLIQPIGEWVLHAACRQVRQMQQDLGRSLHVAVNISPRQFFQADLPEMIRSALEASGLAPECLEIEITEGVLVENAEETIDQLRAIRRLGVQVAIDDFGTGYSSLAYLTCFPIDKLKIDKSFVRDITEDPNDAAVTSAIIVMAHTLKLQVVAEGVENEAQYAYLAERGCDVAQGYFFGRPLSRELFVETLGREQTPDAVDGPRRLASR